MLAGTCGPTQDIGGSVPSRNAVTMGSMPSAWVLASGPYSCAKASFAIDARRLAQVITEVQSARVCARVRRREESREDPESEHFRREES